MFQALFHIKSLSVKIFWWLYSVPVLLALCLGVGDNCVLCGCSVIDCGLKVPCVCCVLLVFSRCSHRIREIEPEEPRVTRAMVHPWTSEGRTESGGWRHTVISLAVDFNLRGTFFQAGASCVSSSLWVFPYQRVDSRFHPILFIFCHSFYGVFTLCNLSSEFCGIMMIGVVVIH